jgi:hypothetical protein
VISFFTIVHKRPDFIKLQYDSIVKNVIGEFEYIVFNNAVDDSANAKMYSEQIHQACNELNIKCIDVQKDQELVENYFNFYEALKDPFTYKTIQHAHAYSIMWILRKYFTTEEKVCLLDSDIFFIDKINLEEELGDKDVICIPQYRNHCDTYYMWTAFAVFNLKKAPVLRYMDWRDGAINGVPCDSGGMQHFFFKENKLNSIPIQQYSIQEFEKIDDNYKIHTIINGNINYSLVFDKDFNLLSFNHIGGDKVFSDRSFPHEECNPAYDQHVATKTKQILKILNDNDVQLPSPWMTGFIGFEDRSSYFILHYIAGSNYISHYTPDYNKLKTDGVKKIVYK